MLFTAHVLTGALLGRVLHHVDAPVALGLPLGVASHLGMDVVPHWGTKDEATFLRVARVDGSVALVAAGLALAAAPPRARAAVAVGIAGAGLIDLDKPCRHFFGSSPFPRRVDAFHERIQEGVEAPRRWPVDVLTATAVALLLARSRGR